MAPSLAHVAGLAIGLIAGIYVIPMYLGWTTRYCVPGTSYCDMQSLTYTECKATAASNWIPYWTSTTVPCTPPDVAPIGLPTLAQPVGSMAPSRVKINSY